jgi:nucleoid associated protein NdpA
MQLLNLSIDRIIIHQIYRLDEDGNKVLPTRSTEYINFDTDALSNFKTRITEALGSGSKAVQMEIIEQDTNDTSTLVNKIIDQDDESFAISSYDLAKKLADAQTTRSIPGGIVVIFSGKQGHPQKKFLGLIKAEVHSAYEKKTDEKTKEISLEFIEEVLLTPASKLYKTAGFFEKAIPSASSENLNDKWTVMVSDNQISQSEGKAASHYFYSSFLGFGYPETSARTTKQFYEATSSFIGTLPIAEEKKSDLYNALSTYLKVSASPIISSSGFAELYFNDIDTSDAFNSFMEEQGIPDTAFTKDIEHIKSKLKHRKVNFGTNIKITAPSEIFQKLISIETIDGEPDESGNMEKWTKIIVKHGITQQE